MSLWYELGKATLLGGAPFRCVVASIPSVEHDLEPPSPKQHRERPTATPLAVHALSEDGDLGEELGSFDAVPRPLDEAMRDTYCIELPAAFGVNHFLFRRDQDEEEVYGACVALSDAEREILVRDMRAEDFLPSRPLANEADLETLTRRALRLQIGELTVANRRVSTDDVPADFAFAGRHVAAAPVDWLTEAVVAELHHIALFGVSALSWSSTVAGGELTLAIEVRPPVDLPFSDALIRSLRDDARNDLRALYQAAAKSSLETFIEASSETIAIRTSYAIGGFPIG